VQGDRVEVPSSDHRTLNHMASLTGMDQSIGRLLALLKELQLEQRTLIIFLSDNGAGTRGSNGPLRGGKADLWEGGIRVPCIIRYPDVVPAGLICNAFLSALEIVPTVLQFAHVETPANLTLDGYDMLPVLAGSKSSIRNSLFWQRRQWKAARVGNWKWVDVDGQTGLFNLSADPGEKRNLSKSRRDRVAELAAQFDAWRQEMASSEPRGPFRDY